MYDWKELGPAGGDSDMSRPVDRGVGKRRHFRVVGDYGDRRALIWRSRAMRDFHPMAFAAELVLRAPGGGMAAGLWRRVMKDLFRPYRPELHYMRGPGPKWHEKHGDDPR
jgi:hypothetical protein